MKRVLILFTVAMALPGAVLAATSAAKAPVKPATASAAKPAPLPLNPGQRRVPLSAEGNAIAQKIFGAPDPRAPQIQAEIVAIRQDQSKLLTTQPIDVDKFAAILQRSEAVQGQVMKLKDERLVALLKALSEPDRVALLQQLINPAQPQNSKPVPPGVAPPPATAR